MRLMTITPLRNWTPEVEIDLPLGVGVVRLSEHYRRNFERWSHHLSERDIDVLKERQFWICHDKLNAGAPTEEPDLIPLVRDALLALQVIFPVGARNLVIVSRYHDDRLMADVTSDFRPMTGPVWSRFAAIDPAGVRDLGTVFGAVRQAREKGVDRLIDPIRLLEYGLQADSPHLRLFLFVSGLEALLMADDSAGFTERLTNLLGADAKIFPPDSAMGHQPIYKVADVAADVYRYKHLVARGRGASDDLLEVKGFTTESGCLTNEFAEWQYQQVLHECAVFLLCRALRTVLTLDLMDAVASPETWQELLGAPVG